MPGDFMIRGLILSLIHIYKGYLEIAGVPKEKKKSAKQEDVEGTNEENSENSELSLDEDFFNLLHNIKKGDKIPVSGTEIKEGETSPPKRYTSGSLILAMENAGQLIEDEDLRAQIKGSGIGTSATRAEIIKKLVNIKYLSLNKKTQVITPVSYTHLDVYKRQLLFLTMKMRF